MDHGELPPKKKKKTKKAVAFEEPAAPAPEEPAEPEEEGRDRLGRLLRLARIRPKVSPGRGPARLDAALFGAKRRCLSRSRAATASCAR